MLYQRSSFFIPDTISSILCLLCLVCHKKVQFSSAVEILDMYGLYMFSRNVGIFYFSS